MNLLTIDLLKFNWCLDSWRITNPYNCFPLFQVHQLIFLSLTLFYKQALSFTSTKHLETYGITSSTNEDKQFVPAICTTHEVETLFALYRKLHPSIFDKDTDVYVVHMYRKMLSVSVNGQRMKAGQYFHTRSVFQFPDLSTTTRTISTGPNVHPAKLQYFFVQCIEAGENEFVESQFAVVSWPMLIIV